MVLGNEFTTPRALGLRERLGAIPLIVDDGSPLAYPVHAVLYGRSDGGKTMFSRVISRSMFGLEQMVRGKDFTTQRALGLRERLGAIPLIVDDVNRDRFTLYVPDLVKFDHESGEG